MNRSEQLGEEKIIKLLIKFSVPAIVGMMVNGLYNVVDRIFVGRGVGSLAIAGITIVFPIMILLLAFGMLIGLGGTALVSIRLGQKRVHEAEEIMANSLVLLIILPIIISIPMLLFLEPILKLLGASDAVLPYAKDFVQIILLGSIFQTVSFGMNCFIRGEGNPKVAMNTMLIGGILNAILCPIFIYTFGWGIRGSAIATVVSQAVSATWVMHYFLSGKSLLKIYKKNLRLRWDIVKGSIAIGSAPFALQVAAGALTIIMNNSLQIYGGDNAISGMGLVNTVTMIVLMPIFGINQGSQPIIGYNYGARKYDRVKSTLKYAITAASSIVIIGFIFIMAFPKQIIGIFAPNNAELIDFGAMALRTFLIFMPIIGFQIVSSAYFQAVGKPGMSMLLSLSRQVLLLIPAILILPHFFGLKGILYAGPTSDLLSSILSSIVLLHEMRHLDTSHESTKLQEV